MTNIADESPLIFRLISGGGGDESDSEHNLLNTIRHNYMIRHTEARDAYENVLNGARIFPFNETMRIANGRANILTGMVYLWKYFRGIKNGEVGDYNRAGEVWRSILQFVPDHRMTTDYDILFNYFNQKLNYTPINIHKNSLSYC